MATVTAKARRRALVQQRLDQSTRQIATRLGIALPDAARPARDPELSQILDLERQAEVLDRVLAAVPEQDARAEAAKPRVSRSRKVKE